MQSYLREQDKFYHNQWTSEEIKSWQLKQFNRQWLAIRRDVPYFQHVTAQNRLPVRFSTWQEFREQVPLMDRRTIQSRRNEFVNKERAPDLWRSTGGSTAEPMQIPAWTSEGDFLAKDMWYARSWFGVSPADKLFLLWGHSHLLGTGVSGWLNATTREIKDRLLGYCRYSAYDLSESGLRLGAETLIDFRPAYVIGYAVALDRFAKVNRDRRADFHKLDLKVAIATAESFPTPESATLIADILGCRVVMEYGAVETGLVAHQRLDGHYSVFWRHYFVEGTESAEVPGTYEIVITGLYPRCFPLVRYRLGDLVATDPDEQSVNQHFKAVIGRCNDYIALPNGNVVHSEAFTHAVKDIPSISAYQVVQSRDGIITLQYLATSSLKPNEVESIRRRLNQITPHLAGVRLQRVESLEQTIAGKTRRIVREIATLPDYSAQA